jgi:hypothetical protein
MKASVKEAPARAPRTRSARPAVKIADHDLAQLAQALEAARPLRVAPPEPQPPRYDPEMWSRMFGMWS